VQQASHSGSDAAAYRVPGAPLDCSYAAGAGVGILILTPLLRPIEFVPAATEAEVAATGCYAADMTAEMGAGLCSAASSSTPSPPSSALALVFDGVDSAARRSLLRLTEPPIPPMVRAPLTNLAPDYLLVGSELKWKGWGGVLAAGFLDSHWQHQPHRAYDTC